MKTAEIKKKKIREKLLYSRTMNGRILFCKIMAKNKNRIFYCQNITKYNLNSTESSFTTKISIYTI